MGLHWVIESYDEVQSTQDIVKGMADMGQPEGHVVQAASQAQGRGRHGRVWQSLEGNLFLSILLRPSCQARAVGQLSLICGLAVLKAIESVGDTTFEGDLKLKWPNDILLNGDKCAGLLLETELTPQGMVKWATLGIGINVAKAPKGIGTDLNSYAEKPFDILTLRDGILKQLNHYYVDWLKDGFDAIRLEWLSHSHAVGETMQVKIGPQLENGAFHDIDADGNLRLRDAEHRLKTIHSGEVYLF